MERYNRHIRLAEVGIEGQQRLLEAKVLVIGAGGLGCPVLQYLAAAGIGTLGIMDHDKVAISNLQRQVLFTTKDVGKSKALTAKKQLFELNPTIQVNAIDEALSPTNALDYLALYDIIVDGTDNFEARYWINDACILLKKPLVYGAIYKYEGQVSVFNYEDGPSYRCLFPSATENNKLLNCNEVGVLGVLPGIIGSFQANEVLKIVLKIGIPLSGKLLCYNILNHTQTLIGIPANKKIIQQVKQRNTLIDKEVNDQCTTQKNITIAATLKRKNICFIDVRAVDEHPKINAQSILNIPLNELENRSNELSSQWDYVFFCRSGTRSQKAVHLMEQQQINNCFSLVEGAQELSNFLKQAAKE